MDADDFDIFGANAASQYEHTEFDFEENYEDQGPDEDDNLGQTFSDLQRATLGISGVFGQELGSGDLPNKYKTKRESALIDLLKISSNSPFSDVKKNDKEEINKILIKIKDLEYFNLPILFSAAVYIINNKSVLNATKFKKHIDTYSLLQETGDSVLSKKKIEAVNILRYIRKLKNLGII